MRGCWKPAGITVALKREASSDSPTGKERNGWSFEAVGGRKLQSY